MFLNTVFNNIILSVEITSNNKSCGIFLMDDMAFPVGIMQQIYDSLNDRNLARARAVHTDWLTAERLQSSNKRAASRARWVRRALEQGFQRFEQGDRDDVLVVEIPAVVKYTVFEAPDGCAYMEERSLRETRVVHAPTPFTHDVASRLSSAALQHADTAGIFIVYHGEEGERILMDRERKV